MAADLNIHEGIHRFAKVQAEKSKFPTYFYKFSYDKELTTTRAVLTFKPDGACHLDEVEYLFHLNLRSQLGFKPYKKGTDSYKVMEMITELWTNFATYGTPTPAKTELIPVIWEPIDDGTRIRYLNIDADLEMNTMTNIEQHFLSAKFSICKTAL